MQDFSTAMLKADALQELLAMERKLSEECGQPIVLVAYSPESGRHPFQAQAQTTHEEVPNFPLH